MNHLATPNQDEPFLSSPPNQSHIVSPHTEEPTPLSPPIATDHYLLPFPPTPTGHCLLPFPPTPPGHLLLPFPPTVHPINHKDNIPFVTNRIVPYRCKQGAFVVITYRDPDVRNPIVPTFCTQEAIVVVCRCWTAAKIAEEAKQHKLLWNHDIDKEMATTANTGTEMVDVDMDLFNELSWVEDEWMWMKDINAGESNDTNLEPMGGGGAFTC